MKILHISEQPGFRGGEQQASWLVQGLVRAGHRCWIAARPGSGLLENDHGGVAVTRVPVALRNEGDLASAWRLARLVRREGIDIIHAHSSHAHSLALTTRMLARRGKVVVHRRVSFPPKGHVLNRWKYRMPDRYLCVSEAVAGVLEACGVDPEKIVAVPSAVDLSRLEVPPADRAALGLADDQFVVFTAGALSREKDHRTLIKAFARVNAGHPETRLLIAGGGDLADELSALVASKGLSDSVRLLGHRADVPALLRMSDLYVSSSYSEGLGTSVLEALAAKVPVVAAVAGGIGEMVHTGETGILVPNRDVDALAEAIGRVVEYPEAAEKWKEQGRALVESQYTAARMVSQTIVAYEELLQ